MSIYHRGRLAWAYGEATSAPPPGQDVAAGQAGGLSLSKPALNPHHPALVDASGSHAARPHRPHRGLGRRPTRPAGALRPDRPADRGRRRRQHGAAAQRRLLHRPQPPSRPRVAGTPLANRPCLRGRTAHRQRPGPGHAGRHQPADRLSRTGRRAHRGQPVHRHQAGPSQLLPPPPHRARRQPGADRRRLLGHPADPGQLPAARPASANRPCSTR